MNLENKSILITGGSSGIGLELAKNLAGKGNKVIICGRSAEKLQAAVLSEPRLLPFVCDVSDPEEIQKLVQWISDNHPDLNVLINNAAIVSKTDFFIDDLALEKANLEYQTNLLAPIRLIKHLYPILIKNESPAIINVTTGLVYAPRVIYPFYNSSKSALHSFTQTLRLSLAGKNIQVFEVLFPAVDTPWHQGNPPKIAIPVSQAVREMLAGLKKDTPEIRVGGAKILYLISRLAPGFALKKVNQIQ